MGGQASVNTYAASADSSEQGSWLSASASLSVSLVAGSRPDKYTQVVLTQGFTPYMGMGASRGPYLDTIAAATANTTTYKAVHSQTGIVRRISPYMMARSHSYALLSQCVCSHSQLSLLHSFLQRTCRCLVAKSLSLHRHYHCQNSRAWSTDDEQRSQSKPRMLLSRGVLIETAFTSIAVLGQVN
jgi:hypothetical protein